MGIKARKDKKLFVLDTNVLMHDPTALFRFAEHDVFLPMVVLEELDRAKKGTSEVARNSRQVSRFLDELMQKRNGNSMDNGLPLSSCIEGNGHLSNDAPALDCGHLFFQTQLQPKNLPVQLTGNGNSPDNNILGTALALAEMAPDRKITLVSKDINLRIKAAVVGIHTEDYHNDQVLDDVNLLYSGQSALPTDFWETHSKEIDSWQEGGHTFYKASGPDTAEWYVGQCLYMAGDQPFEAIVRRKEGDGAIIELVNNYRSEKHAVWGINARNREQNFALNLLMDPEIDFVSLLGTAGTGKTLLALAAGLAQV
ncbi:PhoH family protein, partial [Candidatus Kaiserbacteria bacterium]|nr:PhoH family protein [Candidatus Kaiserbacteria bacterium]